MEDFLRMTCVISLINKYLLEKMVPDYSFEMI